MRKLSLFSGIGGDDLASDAAGIETVCFVERDKYCQQVLKKHWPDIPIIEDVKNVTKERIQAIISNSENKGIERRNGGRGNDLQQSSGRDDNGTGSNFIVGESNPKPEMEQKEIIANGGNEWRSEHGGINRSCDKESNEREAGWFGDMGGIEFRRYTIDIISGGFPCQPHSVAGKRKGSSDERNLWPEVRRILREFKPRWFVGENVPGLFSSDGGRFFNGIVSDLAALGYAVGWCTYGAVDVGALHRRNRVFIVGYSQHNGQFAT
ncbi:MAG: DNA cytosine methyltransferase, partial [Dehalococcoidia bacterium]